MYIEKQTGLGCCGGMGALTMDGTGLFGTGIFGGNFNLTDFSTWGPAEVGALLAAAFVLFSITSTTQRGVEGVQKRVRKLRRARA